MIWYDMSYNRLDADFLNKFETEPEDNTEEEDHINGLNETNSLIFSGNGCFLYSGRAIYPSTSFKTLYFKEKRYLEMEEEFC